MDLQTVNDRQEGALLRIIAALFAMAELAKGGIASTLLRHVYDAILRTLRPVETAMRRLMIVAARGIEVSFRPARAVPAELFTKLGAPAEVRLPEHCLIDPLKYFVFAEDRVPFSAAVRSTPCVSVPGAFDRGVVPVRPFSSAEDPISANSLSQWPQILKHALETPPKQAPRLACRRQQQRLLESAPKPGAPSMLRPGFLSVLRRRYVHVVNQVLSSSHYFAAKALSMRYTP